MIDGEEITLNPSHMERIRMQKDEELNLSSDDDEKNIVNATNGTSAMLNGAARNGVMPNGMMPNGPMPNGMMPYGMVPNMFAEAMYNQMGLNQYGMSMANGQGHAAATAIAAGQTPQFSTIAGPNGAGNPNPASSQEEGNGDAEKSSVEEGAAVGAETAATTTKRKAEDGDTNEGEASAEQQSTKKPKL
jgi:hypothetical protein